MAKQPLNGAGDPQRLAAHGRPAPDRRRDHGPREEELAALDAVHHGFRDVVRDQLVARAAKTEPVTTAGVAEARAAETRVAQQAASSVDARAPAAGRSLSPYAVAASLIEQLALAGDGSQRSAGRAHRAQVQVQPVGTSQLLSETAIELSHPTLGPLQLRFTLGEGSIELRVTTSSSKAAQVLRDSSAMLQRAVATHGAELRSVRVMVDKRRSQQRAAHRARWQNLDKEA